MKIYKNEVRRYSKTPFVVQEEVKDWPYFAIEFFQLLFKCPLSLPLDIQRTHQRIKLIKNVNVITQIERERERERERRKE